MSDRRPPSFTVVHGAGKRRSKYETTEREKYERRRKDHESARAALQRVHKSFAQLQRFDDGFREARSLVSPQEPQGSSELAALHWHVQSLMDELRACLWQLDGFALEVLEATKPSHEATE